MNRKPNLTESGMVAFVGVIAAAVVISLMFFSTPNNGDTLQPRVAFDKIPIYMNFK